jgi:hypothetical protein
VRRVTFDRFDKVGDEVVTLLELYVDIGERLIGPLPHCDEAVVDTDHPNHEDDNDAEDNPASGGHETAPD